MGDTVEDIIVSVVGSRAMAVDVIFGLDRSGYTIAPALEISEMRAELARLRDAELERGWGLHSG